jgi:WD40 repeat protein
MNDERQMHEWASVISVHHSSFITHHSSFSGVSVMSRLLTVATFAFGLLLAAQAEPAVAGQRQIALYHSDTAELLGVLPFPEGIPYVLKFSRSGALLMAGGGQNVRRGLVVVYDVRTGKRLFEVGDELDVVLAADIHPDNARIALGGPEKIVRVFNTADGSLAYEIRKHTDWIYAVEFSPDGVLLATADRAGGLMVWEAETGREFQNLEGHKGAVTGVSFRSDSNVLASGSEDGTIKFWGMEDGRQLRSIAAHGAGVTWVQYTHDGRLVSCGRDRLAKVWDAEGKPIRTFEPMAELVTRAALSHDGGRVAAGDWSGQVRLWNTADGTQVALLAANPPTLQMAAEAARAKSASADAAAQKAAAELADASAKLAAAKKELVALEKLHAGKATAAKAAADTASAAKAAAEKAAAEKAAFEKAPKPAG